MVPVAPEPLIQGDGTRESTWLAWKGLAQIQCQPLDSWVPRDARLVVVAPHPDDEVLACGGLIAMHAQRGGSVLLIAITDGEASHGDCFPEAQRRLAAARRRESTAGLAHLMSQKKLGVVRLGFPDGEVAAHSDRLAADLHRVLQPWDTVVCTWRLDGHPDHEAGGAVVAHVSAAVGCRFFEAPVWMWHWATPGDARVPWHRMGGLAISDEALGRKCMALAAHETQLRPRGSGEGPVLGPHTVERIDRRVEHFLR